MYKCCLKGGGRAKIIKNFFWLQYVPFLVETCQKKFRNFWMTVHGVTALFCHAFYILFESISCIRLKVGVAKRDVIEGCLHVAM